MWGSAQATAVNAGVMVAPIVDWSRMTAQQRQQWYVLTVGGVVEEAFMKLGMQRWHTATGPQCNTWYGPTPKIHHSYETLLRITGQLLMTIKEDVMLCMEERQQEEKRKKKAEDAASAAEGRGVMVATAEAAMGVMVDGKGATAAVSAPREDMGGVSTAGVPLAATPVSDATMGGSRVEETLRTEVARAAVATTAVGVTASLVTVPGAQQTTGMAVGRSGGAAAAEGVRAAGRGATSTAAGRPSGQDLLTAGGRTAGQVVGPVAAASAGAGTAGVVTNSGGGDAAGGEDAESGRRATGFTESRDEGGIRGERR